MKNIVSAEADISDVNKSRREKPMGDMVDARLPENNQGHKWNKDGSENMQQDEILNEERSVSDNPGENARNLDGKLADNSKQKPTVPDDFYNKKSDEMGDRNKKTMRFIDSM